MPWKASSILTRVRLQQRQAKALREILDWDTADDGKWKRKDPVLVTAAEDGSGVGAALIAALTLKRVQEGNLAGIKDEEALKIAAGAK